jgi:hypothetical protein
VKLCANGLLTNPDCNGISSFGTRWNVKQE